MPSVRGGAGAAASDPLPQVAAGAPTALFGAFAVKLVDGALV
jgi:hypothetical protein